MSRSNNSAASSDAQKIRETAPQDARVRNSLASMLAETSIPADELGQNLVLFQDRRAIARILFANEIYQKILPLHGNVFEFGVRYGANLSLFASMRSIYEPFNPSRKIVGFDTFAGFADPAPGKDAPQVRSGQYSVTSGHEVRLRRILELHEQMSGLPSLRRFELIKGDASKTFPQYLRRHPETLVALAYFDFDVYAPTKKCLKAILPYLTKGAVLVFDELNAPEWPGETLAVREVLGTNRFKFIHSPFKGLAAWTVFE